MPLLLLARESPTHLGLNFAVGCFFGQILSPLTATGSWKCTTYMYHFHFELKNVHGLGAILVPHTGIHLNSRFREQAVGDGATDLCGIHRHFFILRSVSCGIRRHFFIVQSVSYELARSVVLRLD